jgi:hypothetical protein
MLWRHALARAGDFPDTITMSDTLLARRLLDIGLACHFVPDLVVFHRHSKGMSEACRQAWRAGRIDGSRKPTSYLPRIARGLSNIRRSSDPAAATLNVALDGVFLAGHATSMALTQIATLTTRLADAGQERSVAPQDARND